MNPLIQLIIVLLVILGAAIVFKLVKAVGKALKYLVINSLVGLVTIYILNMLHLVNIPLNLFTLLVVAIGGLWGVILLIIMYFMHMLI